MLTDVPLQCSAVSVRLLERKGWLWHDPPLPCCVWRNEPAFRAISRVATNQPEAME